MTRKGEEDDELSSDESGKSVFINCTLTLTLTHNIHRDGHHDSNTEPQVQEGQSMSSSEVNHVKP